MYINGEDHQIGDLVKVVKGFWEDSTEHVGKQAIVEYTYASKHGGSDNQSLSLIFECGGSSAWWNTHQLELISRDKLSLVDSWKKSRDDFVRIYSDLDFIFTNLDEVVKEVYPPSIQAVFSLLGGGSLWGKCGEGYIYYNKMRVLMLLTLFNKMDLPKTKESFIDFVKTLSI